MGRLTAAYREFCKNVLISFGYRAIEKLFAAFAPLAVVDKTPHSYFPFIDTFKFKFVVVCWLYLLFYYFCIGIYS